MINQAEGEMFLFRIDETENKKGKKIKEHVMVDDWREIKRFFNQHAQDINNQEDLRGLSGEVFEQKKNEETGEMENDPTSKKYYYIKTKEADWRAIESLFDRVFGKSTQHISTDEGENENDKYEQLNGEQLDRHIGELKERIRKIAEAKGEKPKDTDNRGTPEEQKE